jgi:vacuolar-type H+-ATPase subunit I/STV1
MKFKKYKPNKLVYSWFNELEYHLCYTSPEEFVEMEIILEHAEIPIALDFIPISDQITAFILVFHTSNTEKVMKIFEKAKEIEKVFQYYDEEGLNLTNLDLKIDIAYLRHHRGNDAIENAKTRKHIYRAYMEILSNSKQYLSLKKQFRESYSNDIVRIEGFVPTSRAKSVCLNLDAKFHSNIRINTHPMGHSPKSLKKSSVRENDTKYTSIGTDSDEYQYNISSNRLKNVRIPTLVKTNKIFRPFRILVDLYGVTNYKEIDPAVFVGLTYPILFGLMFGDIGHGLILILSGILLAFFTRSKKGTKIYDGAFLLIWLGIFSAIAGFLYGEAFGYPIEEHFQIEPMIGNPLHNVTGVLKISIIIGVIHLSLGWVLAMLNEVKEGKRYLALVDPLQKILILVAGSYIILTFGFELELWLSPDGNPPYPIILPLIPTLVLLFGKPLGRVLRISYLKEESVGEIVGEQAIDVGETYLNILSNVASYSRLLALAMAHVGLMLMVTELVVILEQNTVFKIVILIGGNLFIIVMESVLAGIHALRLTFYEFFGKFYLGNGIPYQCAEIQSFYSNMEFIDQGSVQD